MRPDCWVPEHGARAVGESSLRERFSRPREPGLNHVSYQGAAYAGRHHVQVRPVPGRALRCRRLRRRLRAARAPPPGRPRPTDVQARWTSRTAAGPRRPRRALVCLVNAERTSRGLRAARDGDLAQAARRHSADMVRRSYFAHESPSGDASATASARPATATRETAGAWARTSAGARARRRPRTGSSTRGSTARGTAGSCSRDLPRVRRRRRRRLTEGFELRLPGATYTLNLGVLRTGYR